MARVAHLEEMETIHVASVNWLPVRRALAITRFGVNAYSADRGERLIEEHDEIGRGAGRRRTRHHGGLLRFARLGLLKHF
ncbi:MAG: hypothetical protein ACTHQQ_00005, partial [Solirubrobacteraceae bacterium]